MVHPRILKGLKMNCVKRWSFFLFCTFTCTLLQAQGLPLRVGIEAYSPPYIMEGTKRDLYGFDIDMMMNLCAKMDRTCQFQKMTFGELINATATNKVDVAVAGIGISAERAKLVNFSLPYLMINLRILTRTDESKKPFDLTTLNNKRIGLVEGTLYAEQLPLLSIENPKISTYRTLGDELLALQNNEIDYMLLDNPTASYWQINSSGKFHTYGDILPLQYTLGIAVNPQDPLLLASINKALQEYLNDGGFQKNYSIYLSQFK
jgi:polar amino acid transport system substrate-binding protein